MRTLFINMTKFIGEINSNFTEAFVNLERKTFHFYVINFVFIFNIAIGSKLIKKTLEKYLYVFMM